MNRFYNVVVISFCLLAFFDARAAAIAQSNVVVKNGIQQRHSYLLGAIRKIDIHSQKCTFEVDEVLVGDAGQRGKSIDIWELIDANNSEGAINGFRPPRPFSWGHCDGQIYEGLQVVIELNGATSAPSYVYPKRIADRFRAVAEFAKVRESLANDKIEAKATVAIQASLLAKLSLAAKAPFWIEFREGVQLDPRVEEICGALVDIESKKGEKIIEPMMNDSKVDVHLRAALLFYLATIHPETDLSSVGVSLIGELESHTSNTQDACAILALTNVLFRADHSQTAALPDARQLILESLAPSTSTEEYRLAFAKRMMRGWREPHQKRRFDAIYVLLKTESCDPNPKTLYTPSETVGDWLTFHVAMAQATGTLNFARDERFDSHKIHATVQERLGISRMDPNRK